MSYQHVFIIGGSSGIGLATASLLLAHNYKVTIAGRSEDKLLTAKGASGPNLTTVVLDAANPEDVRKTFAAQESIDHLVLAVGSTKGAGPFGKVTLAEVVEGFKEKFYVHFDCAQAVLPYLSKRGSITFLSAVTAEAAMPGTAGIGAANAAIAALVPTLAAELKPIRVNGVSPGVIDTPWWSFLSADQKKQAFDSYASKTPVERVGQPEDIAEVIALLIRNTFTTGQTIICDGGLRLVGA